MILQLNKTDFAPKYSSLLGHVYESGFKHNNYSLISSTVFSEIVTTELQLMRNPNFRLPFGMDCEYNKILKFIEAYDNIMIINN